MSCRREPRRPSRARAQTLTVEVDDLYFDQHIDAQIGHVTGMWGSYQFRYAPETSSFRSISIARYLSGDGQVVFF